MKSKQALSALVLDICQYQVPVHSVKIKHCGPSPNLFAEVSFRFIAPFMVLLVPILYPRSFTVGARLHMCITYVV